MENPISWGYTCFMLGQHGDLPTGGLQYACTTGVCIQWFPADATAGSSSLFVTGGAHKCCLMYLPPPSASPADMNRLLRYVYEYGYLQNNV